MFYRINKLPATKIIPMWFFIILISSLAFNSIFTNLNYIEKPMTIDPYMTYQVLQNFILPIGTLIILNVYLVLTSPLKKFGWLLLGGLCFMIVERVIEQIGIITYSNWKIWNSALLWFSIIILSIIFLRFLKRGGQYI